MPPLPSYRGGIKAECEVNRAAAGDEQSGLKAFIEHAWTGNIRSTCRVKMPGDKSKRSWAEITQRQHEDHATMISQIAMAINKGEIVTRSAAHKMKETLLSC